MSLRYVRSPEAPKITMLLFSGITIIFPLKTRYLLCARIRLENEPTLSMAPQNRKLVLPITLIGKVYGPKEPQEVAFPILENTTY